MNVCSVSGSHTGRKDDKKIRRHDLAHLDDLAVHFDINFHKLVIWPSHTSWEGDCTYGYHDCHGS